MVRKGTLALMACVFALCMALVGCGGGNNAVDNKAMFIGTWDLTEMNQDGEITSSEDLETLKALGLEAYANFNEDGTMTLSLFGEPYEGTWEASSATDGTIEMEGQSISMSISDEQLSFEQDSTILKFKKGEAKEAPSQSSDESQSGTADESAATVESTTATESETAEASEEASEPVEEATESATTADEAVGSESTEATASATEETGGSESSSSSAAE